MTGIEPGWYKDPAEPTTQRYWDGEGWIGDPVPVDAKPPPGPPAPASPSPPPSGPSALQAPASGGTRAETPASGGATAENPASGGAAAETPAPGGTTAENPAQPQAGPASGPGTAPPGVPAPPEGWPPQGSWGPPGRTTPPGSWPPPPGWGPPSGTPPPGWQYPFPYSAPAPAPQPHGMPLAASGARLLARLIDIFVVLVLNVVVNGWFVYEYVREVSPVFRELWNRSLQGDRSTAGLAFTERGANLQIVIVLLAAALWFAYEVPAVANTGQTIGKRLLGIRVIRLDNPQRLGFGRSFRRWNTMGLPTLLWCCGIGFVLQLVDALFVAFDRPLHQALHDKSALTVVVHVRPPAPASAPEAPGAPDSTDNTPGGTP